MKRKDYTITIEMSRYSKGFNGGREFYSVGCSKNFGNCNGVGSSCDTEKEVIETIVCFLKRNQEDETYKNHRPPTMRNTEFKNSIAKLRHITLQYFLDKIRGYEQRNLAFLITKIES